jgi:hypothetical protein
LSQFEPQEKDMEMTQHASNTNQASTRRMRSSDRKRTDEKVGTETPSIVRKPVEDCSRNLYTRPRNMANPKEIECSGQINQKSMRDNVLRKKSDKEVVDVWGTRYKKKSVNVAK